MAFLKANKPFFDWHIFSYGLDSVADVMCKLKFNKTCSLIHAYGLAIILAAGMFLSFNEAIFLPHHPSVSKWSIKIHLGNTVILIYI
jgi:hypothetical protein